MKITEAVQRTLAPCPMCGKTDKIIIRSQQVAEDVIDVFFECSRCGYDPADGCGEHVETNMGADPWSAVCAQEIWNEKITGNRRYPAAVEAVKKEKP